MRIKEFVLNIGSAYAHIVISVVLNIMYIPIALHYMGVERYGIWVVLLTIINYLTLANFGIPTAVTNLMSQADDDIEKADLLLNGFKILSMICLGILILSISGYLIVAYMTSWMANLSFEIRVSSLILIVFFILRIPFQISTAAFTANKKIFIGKIYDLLTNIFTFLCLLIVIHFEQSLIFLAALSGVVLLLLNITGFLNALKSVNISNYKKPLNPIRNEDIYRPGIALFAAGMGSLIIWNTDNIVISKFLGFKEVAVYSTAFRLFAVGYMAFSLIYGVLIPYYGQFYKNKLWDKLQSLFNFTLIVIPFISICVWLVGWLFSKDIILLWLGDDKLYGGSDLYFLLGAYGMSLAYVGVMFNLVTCLNLLRGLVYMTMAEAILNLAGSIYLAKIYGASGVAFGSLLASLVVPLFTLPFLIDRNESLQFLFPFKRLYFSLLFYVMMLLGLYLLKADQYEFSYKVLITLFYLSFFVIVQYFFNKNLLKNIVNIFKPANE